MLSSSKSFRHSTNPRQHQQPCTSSVVTSTSKVSKLNCRAQQNESFFDSIKRVAKQVQGALPVIGLVSRLTSSEGGFDELAYPEYSRSIINNATPQFKSALVDLEARYGKIGNSRWVLLVLWMAKTGSGLVPAKDILSAAKRMRVTQDMEIEIDRFDIIRTASLKKYSMMAPPEGKLKDKVAVGVDAICILCLGLKEGEAVTSDSDEELLRLLLEGAFPEADQGLIIECIVSRPQRASAYTAG
ncbi:hypothetical protein CEUSTIGMA_g7141.t1 [Chlamydomonas eustigma]|uniref:Uncharacterized protein n=1 Tax=Chlamydomonas eustigma TaxID=1157962 RepID=A0A250XAB3_9CHLO|nr:hypothetical protein CEUSTIGMA_g7141.t1 [Chlamydomonas eustigma]|eukprot:GAX79700.1 hypothetical protein CEUSTIGMA_g7141.t1 [Chlamydomonas eustigma]